MRTDYPKWTVAKLPTRNWSKPERHRPAHRELAVHSQRVQIGWEVEEGEPKTDAGERTIALDPETQRAERPSSGPRRRESPPR
jgi:hypothetical protein